MTIRKKRKNLSGFTLIELLIVIGIIAILAAAIIVAVSPGDQIQSAREATTKAQMQAIATAIYFCEVEADKTSCGGIGFEDPEIHGDFADVDLPDINHPLGCDYEAKWTAATGGRVEVQQADACTTKVQGVSAITY